VLIVEGRSAAQPTEQRGSTFTGVVWADPVVPKTDGVVVNTVFFTPGARTHWHRHERGQLLQVISGEGWAVRDDGQGGRIRTGDTVWIPPGEKHWHGAAETTAMSHVAVSLGETEWLEPCTDEQYEQQHLESHR
jgi:quercetin dioxygenase-like cupin family protein